MKASLLMAGGKLAVVDEDAGHLDLVDGFGARWKPRTELGSTRMPLGAIYSTDQTLIVEAEVSPGDWRRLNLGTICAVEYLD